MPKRSQHDMDRTRREILRRAAELASVEGLEGVTIGRLSGAISMSKSGLFAHFGSKEELQLAIVDEAATVFEREVFAALASESGLPRLLETATSWVRYLERGPFRGGCFFCSVASEVDDRPGRVRDRVVELTRTWLNRLETEAATAVESGDLAADVDPAQVAFEIHAFVQQANWAFQLHGEADAFARAAHAIRRTIGAVSGR